MVIAIDGPAGAGKSTVARAVAAELGFTYLDSGAMYRCVALAAHEAGVDPEDAEALGPLAAGLEIGFDGRRVLLGGDDASEVSDDTSRASVDSGGRKAGDSTRPEMSADSSLASVNPGGRDVSDAIRTPEVSADASRVSVHPAVREAMVARQRALIEAGDYVAEGRDIGTEVSPDSPLKVFLTASDEERARRRAAETGEDVASVLAAQERRDARDTAREHGALRVAEDAVEIDTTGLSLEEVVGLIVSLAQDRGLAPVRSGGSGDPERTSPQFVREGSPEPPPPEHQ